MCQKELFDIYFDIIYYWYIYVSKRTVWYLNWVQTNDLCWFELFEIELFDNQTV